MKTLIKRLYHALPAPPSTNYLCRRFDINPYQLLPPQPLIFDIGSKQAQARAGYAFGKPPADARIVCVDIEPGPGIDLVADAHDLHMVPANSVDCVLCISMLEHVRDPQQVMREIHRILKPSGIVYANVPFIFPFHEDPVDYYRFSSDGLRVLCSSFTCVDSGFNRGPASTMQHLLVHFLAILGCFNSRAVYGVLVDVFSWTFFWMKYLDRWLGRYEVAKVLHNGAYFIGEKPAEGGGSTTVASPLRQEPAQSDGVERRLGVAS